MKNIRGCKKFLENTTWFVDDINTNQTSLDYNENYIIYLKRHIIFSVWLLTTCK